MWHKHICCSPFKQQTEGILSLNTESTRNTYGHWTHILLFYFELLYIMDFLRKNVNKYSAVSALTWMCIQKTMVANECSFPFTIMWILRVMWSDINRWCRTFSSWVPWNDCKRRGDKMPIKTAEVKHQMYKNCVEIYNLCLFHVLICRTLRFPPHSTHI